MGTKRSRMGMDPLSWILDDGKTTGTGPRSRPRPIETSHTDILEIRDRPLSQAVANYLACPACGFAVRDNEEEARPDCPSCGNSLTEGRFFFKRPVHSLVDLLQTVFHLEHALPGSAGPSGAFSSFDQTVACLLLFTRLSDVLMDHLLRSILRSQNLPAHVCKRLLTDHADYHSRVGRLFPTLTGTTWRGSIEILAADRGLEYVETVIFRQRAFTMLEAFLQLGKIPENSHEVSATCILKTSPFLDLHAHLHNHFVAGNTA